MTPEAQPFREFAAGGYIQADAAAAEAAAKERLRQLDEENEAALFGDAVGTSTSLTARTNEMRLTATRQTIDGTTRKTFEGVYTNPKPDRKQEPSLLD